MVKSEASAACCAELPVDVEEEPWADAELVEGGTVAEDRVREDRTGRGYSCGRDVSVMEKVGEDKPAAHGFAEDHREVEAGQVDVEEQVLRLFRLCLQRRN